jgi:hypothetical protein
MDRSRPPRRIVALLVVSFLTMAASGCQMLLFTPLYLLKGMDVPADYPGLEGKRVVVVCRPPTSLEYRYGSVDREIAKKVGSLLGENVKKIDIVKWADVEQWIDEQDYEDVEQLAKAVKAQMVVEIDLEEFSLDKGSTLRQGKANLSMTVYDMDEGGKDVYQKSLNEILYPFNGGVPVGEKPEAEFRREFLTIVSERIGRHFYKHDPHTDFASDSNAYH